MSLDLFPPYSKFYRSPDVLKLDASRKFLGDARRLNPSASLRSAVSSWGGMDSSGRRRGRVWPIVLSVIVPGAGEIYMGYYKRGIALVAAEIVAWTGYFYYRDQGLDGRDAYENFAETHWDFDRWIQWHPDAYPLDLKFAELDSIGRDKWSSGGGWPAYHPWVDKGVDKQGYYEVIGKYDWFISGWEDFDPDTQPHDTDLRTIYRGMRKESNDDLKTADRFIYLSLAARAFSLVESILLSRGSEEDASSSSVDFGQHFDITVRPRGFHSTEIALEYNF